MANEREQDEQQQQPASKKPVNISDLPEDTAAPDGESVKGGMIARPGGGGTWTDPEEDDDGGGE